MNWKKHASPAVFGLAALMFLLPFGLVSCDGEQIAQVNGIQLVTGATIEGEQIPAQASVLIPLLAAIAAVGVGMSAFRRRHELNAILGAVGLGGLYLFLQRALGFASSEGYGFQAATGLNGAMLLFAIGSGLSIFLAIDTRKQGVAGHESPIVPAVPGRTPSAPVGAGARYCTACGGSIGLDARFCNACGRGVSE